MNHASEAAKCELIIFKTTFILRPNFHLLHDRVLLLFLGGGYGSGAGGYGGGAGYGGAGYGGQR